MSKPGSTPFGEPMEKKFIGSSVFAQSRDDDMGPRASRGAMGDASGLHPGKLTRNLKITCLKRKIIFQTCIFGFHVNLQGCKGVLIQSIFDPKLKTSHTLLVN